MGGKESHADACTSVICRFAHGHPGAFVCLCVYVDVVYVVLKQPLVRCP